MCLYRLVIYTMRQRHVDKSDHKRLLEEEAEGGVEMTDVNGRDVIPERAPVSCVNIAFGQDGDEEEEEGGQEEEEILTQLISGAELKVPTSLKLSPQRQEEHINLQYFLCICIATCESGISSGLSKDF